MTDKDVKLVSTEELAEMDAQTQYLSPIFGSYASDVEMPVDKLNHDPVSYTHLMPSASKHVDFFLYPHHATFCSS